uniref:Uncharacterized protein n=1 Tax=Arundo donax TaxID=35708 RepID=A0A0A9BGB7_ARUDO
MADDAPMILVAQRCRIATSSAIPCAAGPRCHGAARPQRHGAASCLFNKDERQML